MLSGLGMFSQWLCENIDEYCPIEKDRKLSELDPYDHLMRNYRLCTVHFARHVHEYRHSVPPNVYDAMLSLSTTEVLDLDATYAEIRSGGKQPTGLSKYS